MINEVLHVLYDDDDVLMKAVKDIRKKNII